MSNLKEQVNKTAYLLNDIKSALEDQGIDTSNLTPMEYADAVRGIVNNITIENVGLLPIIIFKYSAERPSTPSGGSWNPLTNEMVLPDGWYSDIDVHFNIAERLLPLWMSIAIFSNQGGLYKKWNTPVRISGRDGIDGKRGEAGLPGTVAGITQFFNIPIFYRGNSVQPDTPQVSYDIDDNVLTFSPQGWSETISDDYNDEDVYWQSYVKYNSANNPPAACTVPIRVTAESSVVKGNNRYYQLSNSRETPSKGTSNWKLWTEDINIAPTRSQNYLYCYDETVYSESNKTTTPVYLLAIYTKGLLDIDVAYTVGLEDTIKGTEYDDRFWFINSTDALSVNKNLPAHPDDNEYTYYPGLNERTIYLWCRERFRYEDGVNEDFYRIISYYKAAEKAPVLYSAGVYNEKTLYQVSEEQCPYIFYPVGLYLDDSENVITKVEDGVTVPVTDKDNPTEGKKYQYFFLKKSYEPQMEYDNFYQSYINHHWKKIDSFEAIYSDIGIFKSALVGKFVFDDKYLFSQFGKDGNTKKIKQNYVDYVDTVGKVYDYDEGVEKERIGVASAIEDPNAKKHFIPGTLINAVTGESWFGNGTAKFYSNGEGDLANGAIGWRNDSNDGVTVYIDGNVKIGQKVPEHNPDSGEVVDPEVGLKSVQDMIKDLYDEDGLVNTVVTSSIEAINKKLDGKVTNWFYPYAPLENNIPWANWITLNVEKDHVGDTFTYTGPTNDDLTEGQTWLFNAKEDASGYEWEITDESLWETYKNIANSTAALDKSINTYVTDDDPSKSWSGTPESHEGDLWFTTVLQVWLKEDGEWCWKEKLDYANDTEYREFVEFTTESFNDVEGSVLELNNELDSTVSSWFYDYSPTSDKVPASNWTTERLKTLHTGDTFTNTSAYSESNPDGGKSWQWNGSSWVEITNSNVITALNNAAKAQLTADGKMSTFTAIPTTPYQKGDIWIVSENDLKINPALVESGFKSGEMLNAIEDSDEFQLEHWKKLVNYTDDTVAAAAQNAANKAQDSANKAQDAADEAQSTADATDEVINSWADDAFLNPTEQKELRTKSKEIIKIYNQIKSNVESFNKIIEDKGNGWITARGDCRIPTGEGSIYKEFIDLFNEICVLNNSGEIIGGVIYNHITGISTNTNVEIGDDFDKISDFYEQHVKIADLYADKSAEYAKALADDWTGDYFEKWSEDNYINPQEQCTMKDNLAQLTEEYNQISSDLETVNTNASHNRVPTIDRDNFDTAWDNISRVLDYYSGGETFTNSNPIENTHYFVKNNQKFIIVIDNNDDITGGDYDWDYIAHYYKVKQSILTAIAQKEAEIVKKQSDVALQTAQGLLNTAINDATEKLNKRLDGVVENYFLKGSPTLQNAPYTEWIDEVSLENQDQELYNHIGDTYTNINEYEDENGYVVDVDAGKSWRWCECESITGTEGVDFVTVTIKEVEKKLHWHPIADSDAVKALQQAAKAQFTADGKCATFLSKPDKYQEGDLWIVSQDDKDDTEILLDKQDVSVGDILTAKITRNTYNDDDWDKLVKYTDDTLASEVSLNLGKLESTFTSKFNDIQSQIDKTVINHFIQVTLEELEDISNYGKISYINNILQTHGLVDFDEDWLSEHSYDTYTLIPPDGFTIVKDQKEIGTDNFEGIEKYYGTSYYISIEICTTTEKPFKIVSDIKRAEQLTNVSKTQVAIDGQIKTFVSEDKPVENLKIGDIWIKKVTNDDESISYINYVYDGSDWVDTTTQQGIDLSENVNEISTTVSNFQTMIENANEAAEEARTSMENLLDDNYISPIEKKSLKLELKKINAEYIEFENKKDSLAEFNFKSSMWSVYDYNFNNYSSEIDDLIKNSDITSSPNLQTLNAAYYNVRTALLKEFEQFLRLVENSDNKNLLANSAEVLQDYSLYTYAIIYLPITVNAGEKYTFKCENASILSGNVASNKYGVRISDLNDTDLCTRQFVEFGANGTATLTINSGVSNAKARFLLVKRNDPAMETSTAVFRNVSLVKGVVPMAQWQDYQGDNGLKNLIEESSEGFTFTSDKGTHGYGSGKVLSLRNLSVKYGEILTFAWDSFQLLDSCKNVNVYLYCFKGGKETGITSFNITKSSNYDWQRTSVETDADSYSADNGVIYLKFRPQSTLDSNNINTEKATIKITNLSLVKGTRPMMVWKSGKKSDYEYLADTFGTVTDIDGVSLSKAVAVKNGDNVTAILDGTGTYDEIGTVVLAAGVDTTASSLAKGVNDAKLKIFQSGSLTIGETTRNSSSHKYPVRLGYDGSGHLANGNITWDTEGHLCLYGGVSVNRGNIGPFYSSSWCLAGRGIWDSDADRELFLAPGYGICYSNDSTMVSIGVDNSGITYSVFDAEGNAVFTPQRGPSFQKGIYVSKGDIYVSEGDITCFNGEIYSTGGFYDASDARLKDFENKIEVNLDTIKNIPKKYFRWKDNPKNLNIGTSAQEVQKFYPEIVHTNDDGKLTVDYSKLSIIALAAIDKLHEENIELKNRLTKLEELYGNRN